MTNRQRQMIASLAIGIYRFWHGRLHLKGAGLMLKKLRPFVPGLGAVRLKLPEGQSIVLDCGDGSAYYWLNDALGELYEEEGLVRAVAASSTPDSVVWDIGANAGLFSYRLTRSSRLRALHFFEPNPFAYTIATAALDPFPQVSGHPVALSNVSGEANLTLRQGSSLTGTLESERTGTVGRSVPIVVRTGDELIASGELPAPSVIKIDTEGHELAVLQGLQQLIAMHQPKLFLEHISISDEELMAAVPPGYEVFSVSNTDGSMKPGLDRSRGRNSALLPPDPISRQMGWVERA